MQERWACPDLGEPKPDGYEQPIPGSRELFPDCPAYYLRVGEGNLPAVHLIGGAIHPATIVGERAAELENGAISAEVLSPKVRELVHLYMREKASRREYESEMRRK